MLRYLPFLFSAVLFAQVSIPRWNVRGVSANASVPASCTTNRDVWICSGAGCSPNPGILYCVGGTYTSTAGSGSGTVTSVDASGGVETASGSAITSTGTVRGAITVNAQTGTTYTVLTGDRGKLVTHTNGSSIAVTLPQAGGSFPANWFYMTQNRGAGTVTITPTTSTIDGAASLALLTNQGAIIVSDGTNYFTMRGLGTATGLGDPGSNGVVYRNGAGTSTTASATEIGAPLYAADAGSNDTYTATLSPAPAAYATGTCYTFKANTANTGAATINFNSLGAKTIKKAGGGITTDLSDNDIRSGQFVTVCYDGTNMQMQSTLGNAASGSGNSTTTGSYASNPGTCTDGDVRFPTDSFFILRCASNVWVAWGPVFPFTTPVSGDFTAVNTGSSTLTTTKGGLILEAGSDASFSVHSRMKAVPSTPYHVEAAFLFDGDGGTNSLGGMCISDGTNASTSKFYIYGAFQDTVKQWVMFYMSNSTTYGGSTLINTTHAVMGPVVFLRIGDDGTTNRTFDISVDGYKWINLLTASRTANFTASHIGFCVNGPNEKLVLLSWKETA